MGNIDVSTIVFAVVAIFVVLKLRSVLGTRTGAERPPRDPAAPPPSPTERKGFGFPPGVKIIQFGQKAPTAAPPEPPPPADRWQGFAEPGSPLAAGFDAVAAADRDFAPDRFLAGARSAYEMVVTAFAAGDEATLRRLLAPDVFANFQGAIEARRAARRTMTTTLVSLDGAEIVEARLNGSLAALSVRFAAKLASATRDETGALVDGTSEEPADHLDVWTFARDVRSGDPNWQLAATQTVN
jgi:predicted lipid-binding transport protein (Tim44 family)